MTNTPSWRSDKRTSSERGYNSRWRKARESYLKSHPLCVMCEEQNKIVVATVVNHIIPHKGDQSLFWDKSNWQAVCKLHHDSTIQRQEKQNIIVGCDESGFPLNPDHHWNK